MTVGMVGLKAITAVLVAAVGAGIKVIGAELLFAFETRPDRSNAADGTGIDMVGAELLFAVETRSGRSNAADGTGRQRV